MIDVTVIKSQGVVTTIDVAGHANMADAGFDIVCASVSVLVINTLNSIEMFLDDDLTVEAKEGEDNYIHAEFATEQSEGCKLLLDSLMLGLSQITKEYSDYISLDTKEV